MDNVLEGDGEGRLQPRHVQAVRTEGPDKAERINRDSVTMQPKS